MNTHHTHDDTHDDRPGEQDWTGEVPYRAVAPGEAAGLVAAYRQAAAMAEALRTEMTRAGLAGPAVTVTPSLTERGHPVVRLAFTPGAARRLRALLRSGDPPPRGHHAA